MTELILPVFFFLFLRTTTAFVPSPTNVSFHCHNFQNTLTWEYGLVPPGLRFKVEIRSYSQDYSCDNPLWVDPPSMEARFSVLPEDVYLITVKAVLRDEESEHAPPDGIEFSYNQVAVVPNKCSVDSPPVHVTALPHNQVRVSFQHPGEFYQDREQGCKRRKRHNQGNLPLFKYDILVLDMSHHGDCEQSTCETTLQIHREQDKHCLKLNGSFQSVQVASSQEFCSEPRAKEQTHIYIIALVSVVVVTTGALILAMLYRKLTSPSTPLPRIMEYFKPAKSPAPLTTPDVLDPLQLEDPPSPTPLIDQTQEQEDAEQPCPGVSRDYDFRGALPAKDRVSIEDEGEASEETPSYTHGRHLDGEEDEEEDDNEEREAVPSEYEKRS